MSAMDSYEIRYLAIEEVMKLLLKHLTNNIVSKIKKRVFKKNNN